MNRPGGPPGRGRPPRAPAAHPADLPPVAARRPAVVRPAGPRVRPGTGTTPGPGRPLAPSDPAGSRCPAAVGRPRAGLRPQGPAVALPRRPGPSRPASAAPDWNRDPQVGFDPDVAREAREQGPRPSWRERLPERPEWSRSGAGSGGRGRRGGAFSHWSWPKRIGAVLAVIVLLFVGFGIYLDTQMTRIQALPEYEGSSSSGTNWLDHGWTAAPASATPQRSSSPPARSTAAAPTR